MELMERIANTITPSLNSMGYDLVRVQLMGVDNPTLQVMCEKVDETMMTVEDCANISHAVSALLDVEDPISSAYSLEVSSPGIDRPLVSMKDYERFSGYVVKVETARPIDGRKRFRGKILGLDGDEIRLAMDVGEVRLPFSDVQRAKLVVTDELIAAAQQQH